MRIKSVFLERTKPRKPLKLQELRGFCSKVRYFLLTYKMNLWIGLGRQRGRGKAVSEHTDFLRTYYNYDILKGLGERPRGLYLFLGGK